MLNFPLHLDFGYHFVCLPCRRSMKRAAPYLWNKDAAPHQPRMIMQKVICPECGGAMQCLGKKFTPPPRKNLRQWQKLEWMIQNGWRGYEWPTQPKMNLRQTQEFIAVKEQVAQKCARQNKEDAALSERRRAARYNAARSPTAAKRMKADLERQEKYQTAVLESVASNSASATPTEPTP